MHTASIRRTAIAVSAVAVLAAGLTACAAPTTEPDATEAPESGPVTIYLTRHGETMLNVLERAQGWADSPLTTPGEDVATDLGEGLAEAGVTFDAAYSADMVRHYSTAQLALEGAGQDIEPTRDWRLREIAFGSFEGSKNEEMWDAGAQSLGFTDQADMFAHFEPGMMNDALDAIAAANTNDDLPAETSAALTDRAVEALNDIASEQEAAGGGNVLVVSSGITISLALEELGADMSGVTKGIENAAVCELTYDDGEWTVDTVNDLSYVEAGAGI